MAATDFTLEPHHGALPIKFGMTQKEVADILGSVDRENTDILGNLVEQRSFVLISYTSDDRTVFHLGFAPGGTDRLLFHGTDLLLDPDLIGSLMKYDKQPYEWVGNVYFVSLGVRITGFHDGDDKSISVFKKGECEKYQDKFTPFRRG